MRNKKIKKCAEWLAYCLEIGWSKNDIDGLQELWMANHDDNGNYKAQLQQHSVMQAASASTAVAAVASSAVGKGVCVDKGRKKDEACKYQIGTCEWCANIY